MAAQGMRFGMMDRDQRFHRCPHSIDHPWMKREHDQDLHTVVGVGVHPTSRPGQPNDRWMVTHPTYRGALLVAIHC
jgi:hypothetical protein